MKNRFIGHVTFLFGLAMIALGVVAYMATNRESVTALIPAFVGLPVALCGFVARKGAGRAPIIVALVLSVVAALGPVMRVATAVSKGEFEWNAARSVQIAFVALAGLLAVLIIKSMFRKK